MLNLTRPSTGYWHRCTAPAVVRPVMAVVLIAIVTIVFIKSWSKAATPSRLGDYTRTAILRWKPQIEDLGRGVNIYEVHNYPNPPIMALILRPVVAFSPSVTFAVWFVVKVLLAVWMIVCAVRLVKETTTVPDWLIALGVLLSLHPIVGDLQHGNVNLFVAALVLTALDCYRRSWDVSAGIVLALAVACKVTPALFLPYFVWKRAWKLVIGAAVGLVLWVAVVPSLFLGAEQNQTLTTSWFTTMVKPFVLDGKVTSEHPNQSIPGVVFRLLTSEPSFITYGDDGNGPPEAAERHTIVDLGTGPAKFITKFVTLSFGLLILWTCRTRSRSGLVFAAECSLILLGMLLLSERTWKHHSVTLILPMLTLLMAWWQTGHRLTLAAVVISAVLMIGQSALPEAGQNLALVYGVYTLAYVILTTGIAGILLVARKTNESWGVANIHPREEVMSFEKP